MQLKEANNGDQLQPNMTDRRQKLQRSASFVSDQTSMEFMSEVRLQDLYYLSSVKYTPFHSFFDVSNGIYNSSGYKEKPKNQLTCGHDADTTLDIEKELGHIHRYCYTLYFWTCKRIKNSRSPCRVLYIGAYTVKSRYISRASMEKL